MSTSVPSRSNPRTASGRHLAPTPPSNNGWIRQLLLRLHFYIGVFIGPFLLIAALSGALYAVSPQIERVVYGEALKGTETSQPLSLDNQVKAAQEATGIQESPAAVRPAEPGGTTRVMFADPTLGESEHRGVFVDPGTGHVVGDLTVYGSSGSLPLRTTISQIHRSLLLGQPGRLYSELAASWLWVVALSGLGLWALKWRKAHAGRKARGLLYPDTHTTNSYRRNLSWHSATGVWLSLGFLFLSATGLTWSAYAGANVDDMRSLFGWTTPAVEKSLEPSQAMASGDEHAEHEGHTPDMDMSAPTSSFDGILASARNVGINADQVEIKPPAEAGTAWTVTEIDRSWPTQADAVAVDPTTRQVTDEVRFADYGIMAKLARWGVDAHMGVLFGVLNQIAVAVLALGLAAMIVWGYWMWWQRRPTRATGMTFGPVPARGALRRVPLLGVLSIVMIALLIGTFFPLLGISLVGFLVLDLILGARQNKRVRAAQD